VAKADAAGPSPTALSSSGKASADDAQGAPGTDGGAASAAAGQAQGATDPTQPVVAAIVLDAAGVGQAAVKLHLERSPQQRRDLA
jgi:hypothetical protein